MCTSIFNKLLFVSGYINDINGTSACTEEEDENDKEDLIEDIPWRFTSSLTFHGKEKTYSL